MAMPRGRPLYAPERHLPPLGAVYNPEEEDTKEGIPQNLEGRQNMLQCKCARCFRSTIQHPPGKQTWKTCDGPCGFCSNVHPVGQFCPQAYVTQRWAKRRLGIPDKVPLPDYLQVRPSQQDEERLKREGYIHPSATFRLHRIPEFTSKAWQLRGQAPQQTPAPSSGYPTSSNPASNNLTGMYHFGPSQPQGAPQQFQPELDGALRAILASLQRPAPQQPYQLPQQHDQAPQQPYQTPNVSGTAPPAQPAYSTAYGSPTEHPVPSQYQSEEPPSVQSPQRSSEYIPRPDYPWSSVLARSRHVMDYADQMKRQYESIVENTSEFNILGATSRSRAVGGDSKEQPTAKRQRVERDREIVQPPSRAQGLGHLAQPSSSLAQALRQLTQPPVRHQEFQQIAQPPNRHQELSNTAYPSSSLAQELRQIAQPPVRHQELSNAAYPSSSLSQELRQIAEPPRRHQESGNTAYPSSSQAQELSNMPQQFPGRTQELGNMGDTPSSYPDYPPRAPQDGHGG